MRRSFSLNFVPVVVLAAVVMAAVGGCGSKSSAPPASITGPDLASPDGKGRQKPAPIDERALRYPRVSIDTSFGAITLELDATKSPLTVQNFLNYVDSGFYDQTLLHQVIRDYAIVGGTYDAKMTEKKTQLPIRNEAHNGLQNRRGTIGMARAPHMIDSVTSQFYINLNDNPVLDHKDRTEQGYGYCVFGKVVEGQKVLDKIAGVSVKNTKECDQSPVEPLLVKSVRRVK